MVSLDHKKAISQRFGENIKQFDSLVAIETSNLHNVLINEMKDKLNSQCQGKFLHGKKKTFIHRLKNSDDIPIADKIIPHLKGNVLLYFFNGSVSKVCQTISTFEKYGAAKFNQLALVDYTVKAQHTKLPPETTKYFQKLRITTKLNRGTIEIVNNTEVLEKGKNVTQAQIDVLSLLKVNPYLYKPKVTLVCTKGEIVDPQLYTIPIDCITQTNKTLVSSAVALAHGTTFPIKPVFERLNSNIVSEAFALALQLADKVAPPKEFAEKIAMLNDPEAMAKLQANAAAAAKDASAAVKEEKKEVEEAPAESSSECEIIEF